jgi:putative ATP-dependent endonuclease of the OLD family
VKKKKGQKDGIKIAEARVRNFRCLKQVDVTLDDLTVLIGENNSGKTSFLEALSAAIGAGRRAISTEDVFLATSENTVPKDRMVVVDILVRPTDDSGTVIDNFPQGSFWLELWGNGVAQDDEDKDFVAIRTQMKWDVTRGEYVTERKFLADWPQNPRKWQEAKVNERRGLVSAADIDPLALYLMDAKRDIKDDMQSRTSFWHRLVSDLDLPEKQVAALEKQLTKLNEDIISASDVLQHVQGSLDEMHQAVNSPKGSVSITPTARTLRDLSKGMDVSFSTKGAQTFPLVRHGMGTRSLAALLTFRAHATWRQMKANRAAVHPMLALEEPEAHLHPQAQRALFHMIQEIPGQRIVTTHSPYIAAEAQVSEFRVFRKVGPETIVAQMNLESLSSEDIRRINRGVLNTRGDMLYARALILCSGETEEQALPVFAEKWWGRNTNALGITIQGVGGDGAYLPFVRLADSFGIPWYIFSDGEEEALKKAQAALQKVDNAEKASRLFALPSGECFEKFFATEKYKDVLVKMIITLDSKNEKHKAALEKEWAAKGNPLEEALKFLLANKTRCAKPLALAVTRLTDDELRFPGAIKDLLNAVSDEHKIKKSRTKKA